MRRGIRSGLYILIPALLGILGVRLLLTQAQSGGTPSAFNQAPITSSQVLRTEANLVLVDVVATDRKGEYVKDLGPQDFQVFEDKKLQEIKSFSPPGEARSPQGPSQPRYIVLFFDDSTMNYQNQMWARRAATQFVEKNASPDHLMAVVEFGGMTRVVQNFTADAKKLARATSAPGFSAVSPNEPGGAEVASTGPMGGPAPGMWNIASAAADFGARSFLLAIRNLAKSLQTLPGRKTLILFSEGFPLTLDRQPELDATIDAANRANVAIYTLDVRGLQVVPLGAFLLDTPFPHEAWLLASLAGLPEPDPQHGPGGSGAGSIPSGGGGGTGGGGSTGSGGSRGGSSGGSTSGGGSSGGGKGGGTSSGTSGGGTSSGGKGGSTGSGGTTGGGSSGLGNRGSTGGGIFSNLPASTYACNNSGYGYSTTLCPQNRLRDLFDDTVTANQQVLEALARGTGGFTIFNTNDFLSALNKIANELDQYYILGYVPPSQAHDGAYHHISVKVIRPGVQIRHRPGYYDLKSHDLLAGNLEGKSLEAFATGAQAGQIPVQVSFPYFYSSPQVARVYVALQIPASAIEFGKGKKEVHSKVEVLGIASTANGAVAARFSDTVNLDVGKKDVKDFASGPFKYQTTFNVAPGDYTLKVVLSGGGEKFAKYETPLAVPALDSHQLAITGPALSDDVRPLDELVASVGSQLLEDQTPLIAQGMEVFPQPGNHFPRGDKVSFYAEVFEPQMRAEVIPRVGILFNIVNSKSNQPVYSSNTILVNGFAQVGNPVIPFVQELPLGGLAAGEYRLEVRARNSLGQASSVRSANFVIGN